MSPIVRNILAVIAGLVIGSIVNGCIIMISGSVIPPPAGADVKTMEGLVASMHLFEPRHFIMPFLAHALGTFSGALVAAFIAANHKMNMALVVGVFFLSAGIINVYLLPSPLWFSVLDLAGAYLPMGWIAGKMVSSKL